MKTLCFTFFFLAGLLAQGQDVDTHTKDVMKFKLYFAQGVLEGIVTENFNLIATNASKLKALSQQVGWQVRQTPEYQLRTAEFVRCTEALAAAAKRKNVDAATVAYFELTASCVSCHRHLRETRDAGLQPEDLNRFFRPRIINAKELYETHIP